MLRFDRVSRPGKGGDAARTGAETPSSVKLPIRARSGAFR